MSRARPWQCHCERGVQGSDSVKGLRLVNTKGFWMEDREKTSSQQTG